MEELLQIDKSVIEVQGGNFSWDLKESEVTLKDISLKILTGVVMSRTCCSSLIFTIFIFKRMQLSIIVMKSCPLGGYCE